MTEYELAVRLLSSKNTHLKLRERCRVALGGVARSERSLPPDFVRLTTLAMYRRQQAIAYQQRHWPAFFDLPVGLQTEMMQSYPISGGPGELNTMLYLSRQADEAEAALRALVPPLANPEEMAIDQMVADYQTFRAAAER